jgi:serralysin
MGTYIGTVNGDTIYGSSTADVILGMGGADYLSGGDGNDIIADFDGQNPDTYSDTILGGAGNDTIYAGFGDYINGGSGTDTLNLRLDYTPGSLYVDVSVLWSGGSVTLGGATIQQVELINWVVGGAYNDTLISGTPSGQLCQLTGLGGSDVLIGGAGTDYLSADWLLSSSTTTADNVYDELYGLGGNDKLAGAIGDYFDGGSGTDQLTWDVGLSASGVNIDFTTLFVSGSDTILGSYMTSIEDIAGVFGSEFDDTIYALADSTPTGLYGRGGNDTLSTGTGADRLDGGAGADILNGGGGADTMIGGTGDDTYYLENVGDVTTESTGGGTDTVNASISTTLQAQVENLVLIGSSPINGTGNSLANTITGNAAVNFLDGGGGDDIVIGGGGLDFLTGGAGADRFVFNPGDIAGTTWNSTDQISDFSQAAGDKIDLSGIDAIAGGTNDAFTFVGTAAFSGVAGELRYVNNGTYSTIYGDTNGDGAADFAIALNTGVNLVQGDFLL